MLIRDKRGWELREREATPEAVFAAQPPEMIWAGPIAA